jgi:hypothetical protein
MSADAFIPTAEQIDAVRDWQALQREQKVVRPIVPTLQNAFGVTASQAIAIVRAANAVRGGVDAKSERRL